MTEQNELLLDIHAVTVCYENKPVVKSLSLSLTAGKIIAVIGPNGAGKSTLIRSASGILVPRSGNIEIDGISIFDMSPENRAKKIAVVPQALNLPEAFTAYQTVLMGRTPYLGWFGKESTGDEEIARAAMQRTDVINMADNRIGELSGGEQQRVMIARAIAQCAPIMLMDEPTAHLDLKHQANVLGLVRSLAKNEDVAVLIALHDLNLAASYADEVLLLVDGVVQAVGKPDKVLTPDLLTLAYGVPVDVISHPVYGTPLVLPDGREKLQIL